MGMDELADKARRRFEQRGSGDGGKKQPGQPGRALLLLAAGLLIVAAAFAFWPVSNFEGTSCGSWALKDDSAAAVADADQNLKNSTAALSEAVMDQYTGTDSYSSRSSVTTEADDCADARSNQTGGVIVFGLIGAACLVVGIIRRYQPPTPSSGSPQSSN